MKSHSRQRLHAGARGSVGFPAGLNARARHGDRSGAAATCRGSWFKKDRVDAAVVSAPMIAAIVDGTGQIIYFLVAHARLRQLAGL
ncbi:hypothetical protein K0O64_13145 [Mycolicibacterium pallens]|uniref:Uncharacterized protein n=1 Tax=Mycolicibacterium pallens TaxID=370524 RepID=A0ABX8VQV0_9MYCO|nr:hypothetical protein K0O64_13145 [Mycolicibacterium pallens]